MATPDRDTVYTNDGVNRTVYSRESSSTGWFVGIIVALALLAIGYLVFSANSGPSTSSTTVNNTPAIEAPATDTTVTPSVEAPAPATETTPMETAPATETPAPAVEAPATDATAPATEAPAPATETPAPAAQ
jgi:hypothetical protein